MSGENRFASLGHIFGLVLSLILLVAVAAASFIEFQEYIQVADETRSTNAFLDLVRTFVAEAFEAQACERSFLLMRSERYREAYEHSAARLQSSGSSPVGPLEDKRYRELFGQLRREVQTQLKGMDVEIRNCQALGSDAPCGRAVGLQTTVLSSDRVYAFRDMLLHWGAKDLSFYRNRTRLHAQLCALIASVGCLGIFVIVFLSADRIQKLLKEQSVLNRKLSTHADELHNIADSVPQLLWRMNESGAIEYAIQRWTEFFGGPFNEYGSPWLKHLHPEDESSVEALFRGDPESRTSLTAECRLRTPKEAYRWFLLRALAIKDTYSSKWYWYGTFTDIDDQKRAEASLQRSNDDLRQFAFIAAHDLQEPVRNNANLGSLVLKEFREELAPEAILWLEESAENSRRMMTMIKDLLTFSTAVGNVDVPGSAADAESCLTTAVASLQVAVHEAEAQITHGPLPIVRIGESQLIQVFQNLIGNALKYRRPAITPVIRVEARNDGYDYVFSVADNGIGFDPVYGQRIFRIFKRLHSRREYPGNGIGLAICARVVAHFGGRIWAESQLGQGATFFFTIPAAENQPEAKVLTAGTAC